MVLNFFKSKNFGDALNPYIFEHFLPHFFDDNEESSFVGIGSILGLDHVQKAKKKIVFSSGFAYGTVPEIDDSFDIFCVRGKFTCQVLNIDKRFAICDGAILLQYMEDEPLSKKYDFSFMPHWESALKFNWKSLCEEVGIHYLNPMDDFTKIIKQIKESKVVIAEAMHAAIVADALRVPWVPVKAYEGINDFKWNDWSSSLDLNYAPFNIRSLYNNTDFTKEIIKKKSGHPFPIKYMSPLVNIYELYQEKFIKKKVINDLNLIKKGPTFLSKEAILKSRGEQLLDKIEEVKIKYGS